MMDSDLAMTCSLPPPLIGHQLAHLSINWPYGFRVPQIMYRLSSQLILPLQLSFIYHNIALSLPLSLSLLPLRKFAFLVPSRIIFFCHRQTIKSTPPIPPPHLSLSFPDFPSLAPCPGFKRNESFTFTLCLQSHSRLFQFVKWYIK